jgi:hypothetical protein
VEGRARELSGGFAGSVIRTSDFLTIARGHIHFNSQVKLMELNPFLPIRFGVLARKSGDLAR